jgi:RimJ/RimL family protein N-acetyltransferase
MVQSTRRGNRVSLRDVVDDDVATFFEHQRDPDASAMAAVPARDRAAHSAHWARIRADESVVIKTIVMDGDVVGHAVSWVKEGRRVIGYWVGQPHWGKGIATQAVTQFVAHLEERPLYAHVATHNVGSIRVLEKSGFVTTDEAKDAPPPADGVEELLMKLEA